MPQGPTLITPGRQTYLVLDVTHPALDRPPWNLRRAGGQIARGRKSGSAGSSGVLLQPGAGWTLAPHSDQLNLVLSTESNAVLRLSDFNAGTHWDEAPGYRKPTDLPGIGASGSLITSGDYFLTKKVAAGSNWSSDLVADVSSFPKPTLPTTDIAMDRVLVSKSTYPANCGFGISMDIPIGVEKVDTLFTFYFGGPVDVTPAGTPAGEFAVTVRGSGTAHLWEKSGSNWLRRYDFTAFAGTGAGTHFGLRLSIFPYGRDTIAFHSLFGDELFLSGNIFSMLLPLIQFETTRIVGRNRAYYRNAPLQSTYLSGKSITGAGPIRLDVRRDLRPRLQILRVRPAETGTLFDLPFYVPWPLTGASVIGITAKTHRPTGTDITAQMYRADTDAALTQLSPTTFQAANGVSAYYARFNFTSDEDREQTPVLWAYQISLAEDHQTRSPTPQILGGLRRVSITGPDTTPDHETASVEMQDPRNLAGTLRLRARIPAHLNVYTDALALTTTLFQGEVARATALKLGVPGRLYPSPEWRRYEVDLVGMWARLNEQILTSPDFFEADPFAPVDPITGTQPPYKITAIIAYMLLKAGFPASTLDIPDLDLRLWGSHEAHGEDQMLQPGTNIGDFVLKLARDYLGMVLLWDPNAGSMGMWRLRFNPLPPYANVIAAFVDGPWGTPGKLGSHPNSYAAGFTFIQSGTFRTWVKPPEANYVLVLGAGATLPNDGGPTQLVAWMHNPVSFDLTGATSNGSDPDYIGRCVPLIYCDPTLTEIEAVVWVCRRLYDRVAHAEKWVSFRAPLLLVTDPLDALQVRVRPLRINDIVTVTVGGVTSTCLVRSCNPDWEGSDGVQMAEYEMLAVT